MPNERKISPMTLRNPFGLLASLHSHSAIAPFGSPNRRICGSLRCTHSPKSLRFATELRIPASRYLQSRALIIKGNKMKILALSDWRAQPFDMLKDIIQQIDPDCILYAGDDINRINLPPTDNSILLKTKTREILLDSYTFRPLKSKDEKYFSKSYNNNIDRIQLSFSN